MTPGPAWLPLALLVAPLLFVLPAWWMPGRSGRWVWIAGSAVTLALAAALAVVVARSGPIDALGAEIRADSLGALMALVTATLAFASSLYAHAYLPGHHAVEPARRERLEQHSRRFGPLFLVLESTLFWVALTNNLVLLWVALEATTLASALLVSFYRDRRALEAGWKYLLLLTVGITSAFFGCVLLYAAAAPHLGESSALLVSNLSRVAGELPASLVLVASLLLLVGFGTKAGLAPFHPWVADAHAEAPAVMSALLSSVIIKMPFVGLLRVWSVFGPRLPELNQLLLVTGLFTMVVGAALAVAQDDLKRLHAYSSVSQVGYVAAALGLGSAFGYYAAVFFIVSHALTKGLLFLSTGAVSYAAHDVRSLTALGGLRAKLPVTTACATIGALSLAGMPPFSGFAAQLQVALAAADARAWAMLGIAVATSLLTMAYMVGMLQRTFQGSARSDEAAAGDVREVPATMRWAMGLLAGAVVALGVHPQWLDPLLRSLPGP